MDDIARLPLTDRADLFAEVARQRGLTPAIIEKDFWVCWTLKRLFTLPDPPAGLLFKGGTSLSKVFGIIERFSEDVDLSFDRAGLGFSGDSDPLNAPSGKKRKHGLEALTETCQRVTKKYSSRQRGHGTQTPSRARSVSCLPKLVCRNWSGITKRCGK